MGEPYAYRAIKEGLALADSPESNIGPEVHIYREENTGTRASLSMSRRERPFR